MLSLMQNLRPDFEAELTRLPLSQLKHLGIRALAFDLDNTLAHSRTRSLAAHTVAYLEHLHSCGYKLLLASNALTDLAWLATTVNATVVPATILSRKPLKGYFRRLVRLAGCRPGEVAMIGDNIFTDILGANRSGLISIRIKPDTRN